MTNNKRERELARAKYERQQERRAHEASRRRTRQRVIAIATVAVLVVGALVWAGISLRPDDTVADAPSEAATPTAATDPSVLACDEPGTPRADTLSWDAAPAGDPQAGSITFATNCGDIVIDVLADAAPRTVASAEFLVNEGFYDSTTCHRLTTEGIFVLQCGDPAGNGTGGPGYALPDENLPSSEGVNYPAGTVAMANAGPGTAGSQFFLVYEDTTLPPGYTVWGTITQGLDVVPAIAQAGVAGGATDGAPAQPGWIEKATCSAG
ncbi:MAG: peptidylprolyl isomerase [Actinomycetota bacterium]